MSIAKSLTATSARLRELHRRGNGDLEKALPGILDDLEDSAERVRGLEGMAAISGETLKVFQEGAAI